MGGWFLTVHFPSWCLVSEGDLSFWPHAGYPVDVQSYELVARPFFHAISKPAADALVDLFRAEYGKATKRESRPLFEAVAEDELTTSQRVLYAEAVARVAADAQRLRGTGPPSRRLEGVRAVLVVLHERARGWVKHLGPPSQSAKAKVEGAANAPVVSKGAETRPDDTPKSESPPAENRTSPPETQDKAAVREFGKTKWLAQAMLTVQKHPEWSDATIAKTVGRDKSTLCRNKTYRAAAKMARERSAPPRGHKNTETGEIEAYSENPEE